MDFNNNMNDNNNAGNNNPTNNGYHYNNEHNNTNDYQNPYGYRPTPPVRKAGNSLETAAMVLGILALVTACMMTVYLPFIFGALAIVLALLSKGGLARLRTRAIAGIICATIGLVLNCGIIVSSFKTILENPSMMMEAARTYDDMLEQMYGAPSEEILGESMEDAMSEMYEILGVDE